MDERGGVVPEHRDVWDLLPPHHGRSQVFGQVMLVAERTLSGVDVDHWHGLVSPWNCDGRRIDAGILPTPSTERSV